MTNRKEFRLVQVLERERQQEELKQRELSSLAQQRRGAQEALQALLRQAQELRETMTRRRRERIDAAQLDQARSYLDSMAESIRQQEDVMRALEEQVLSSREALVETLRRKRMLERLQGRHEAEVSAGEQRREGLAADELTAVRRAWQTREAH